MSPQSRAPCATGGPGPLSARQPKTPPLPRAEAARAPRAGETEAERESGPAPHGQGRTWDCHVPCPPVAQPTPAPTRPRSRFHNSGARLERQFLKCSRGACARGAEAGPGRGCRAEPPPAPRARGSRRSAPRSWPRCWWRRGRGRSGAAARSQVRAGPGWGLGSAGTGPGGGGRGVVVRASQGAWIQCPAWKGRTPGVCECACSGWGQRDGTPGFRPRLGEGSGVQRFQWGWDPWDRGGGPTGRASAAGSPDAWVLPTPRAGGCGRLHGAFQRAVLARSSSLPSTRLRPPGRAPHGVQRAGHGSSAGPSGLGADPLQLLCCCGALGPGIALLCGGLGKGRGRGSLGWGQPPGLEAGPSRTPGFGVSLDPGEGRVSRQRSPKGLPPPREAEG